MNINFSRRTILKAAFAVSITGLSCTRKNADEQEEPQWIPAACWHNCGGKCVNMALVSNGKVLMQKTDDTHPDSFFYPQQRGCVRGRAQRRQVFAPDRLKYPIKRAHWEQTTGGDRTLRGRDQWVRISWENALSLVAAEIKRISDKYGSQSILLHSWTEPNEYKRLFALNGGFTESWGTCSYGNWTLGTKYIGYSESGGYDTCNDRLDMPNCETIVMFGCNSGWSAAGTAPNTLLEAKRHGAHFICVDPYYNDTYAMLDADWIPVNPASDTALLLGVAHTLIVTDSEDSPLIDREFLNKATLGFDEAHMPESADTHENFKDYVLGTYDGVPKNAVWASERCGVPAERIKKLAIEIGMMRRVALLSSWGVCRTNNSDSFPQLLMTVGAMTGHMGKSGHMTGVCCHLPATNHGYYLVMPGENGLPHIQNPVDNYINDIQTWDAVLGNPYNFTGNCSHGRECRPCEMRTADIRMIFHGSGNRLESMPGMQKGIEAHRKVEFVVCATTFFTSSAMYSDIILPVNTEWEREGALNWGNREMLTMHRKVIEPLFESRDDQWIAAEIGLRIGIDRKKMYPFGRKQQLFNMAAGATVISEKGLEGGYSPLCTITDDDIARWGVKGTPQQGRILLRQLEETGVYQVERYNNDPYGSIAFKAFRENPANSPRPFSKSGLLEIHSKNFAEKINGMQYGEIKPIPTYIPPLNGYEGTFGDWKNKRKGKYPYQVITIRYIKRTHTVLDNVPVLSEAFHSPVFINMSDAEKLEITTGDTVMIISLNGKILRVAVASARVKPGTIVMLHGSRCEYNEDEKLAYGGADNILFGTSATGQGTAGFNSLLVNIVKYRGKALVNDMGKPPVLPPMSGNT